MDHETPITSAAKRIIRILDTGYLTDNFRRDIETLMQGALAYEVVTGLATKRDDAHASSIGIQE